MKNLKREECIVGKIMWSRGKAARCSRVIRKVEATIRKWRVLQEVAYRQGLGGITE